MTELQQAKEMLQSYLDAEKDVLKGQSMTKDGRTWERANLAEIRAGRKQWQREVKRLSVPASRRGPALASFD